MPKRRDPATEEAELLEEELVRIARGGKCQISQLSDLEIMRRLAQLRPGKWAQAYNKTVAFLREAREMGVGAASGGEWMAAIRALLDKALTGDTNAARLLTEYRFGKPAERTEISAPGEQPEGCP